MNHSTGGTSISEPLSREERERQEENAWTVQARKAIRANRKRTIPLLREVSPEVRQMMAARVATTLDAYNGWAIDYNESPSHLGWGFRHSPAYYQAGSLLNYPSYVNAFPAIVRELAERNAKLPKEVSELIERTWGMYFGGAPFDHSEIATGRYLGRQDYFNDGTMRVLKNPQYICSYEEGQVLPLAKGRVTKDIFSYLSADLLVNTPGGGYHLPIHPQTIQNVVGKDVVVDILAIQSYDHGWPIAQGRIEQALKSMGMRKGKVMKIHFPNHGGDDSWFGGGRPGYTPSLQDQSGDIIDILVGGENPPLIIVQNDYGKGKFHSQAMRAAKSLGLMRNRTVFKYILAHDEVGSSGCDGLGGNVGNIELNLLTFEQISLADMMRVSAAMLGNGDEDSREIVKILASKYLEAEHRNRVSLPEGQSLEGESSVVVTPDTFLR